MLEGALPFKNTNPQWYCEKKRLALLQGAALHINKPALPKNKSKAQVKQRAHMQQGLI